MTAAVAGLTPTELSILKGGAVGCESVQKIINMAATAEAFAVTALGLALRNASGGTLALNAEQRQALRAARAEEQAHYAFLTSAGARPLTTTFTMPDPTIVTDVPTFLKTVITLEEVFIAAYLAAAQEFALLSAPQLAQRALAIAAVEAGHRVAFRFFAIDAGVLTGLPNDVAFQKAKYSSVSAAAVALVNLGFIGGSGARIAYPGPGAIDTTGVTNLTP